MSEDERLTTIAAQLVEDWHNDRVPTLKVVHDDAAAIACGLHYEMDRRTAAREEFARANGMNIVCDKGCAHCCESLVMVFRGESIAIAEWLLDPANEEIRAWYVNESYPRWRAAIGDAPERAQTSLRTGDDETYVNVALEVWQRRVMCAFNREGLCTIYSVRPNACRHTHALDTNDNCLATGAEAPATVPFEEIQNLRFGIRPLTESLHQALGGEAGVTSSVCQEVHELTADAALLQQAGRGQPDREP